MNGIRKKRLITFHLPGTTTYDADGFPIEHEGAVKKVYCRITKAKPNEILTYQLDKITEILRITCSWNAVRRIDPREVWLTINGEKYELFGTIINVDMLGKEAYFEAKKVI
jgi:hypothetical protein